jgi:hypothetical protein
MKFIFNPHENAPLFADPVQANLIVTQLVEELKSGHYSDSNEDLRQMFRQAGYVNLWFFLKYLAGHSGPYNELNTELHLDICNFRQSESCMREAARFGAFLPRSALKSTILTHGSAAWEALRWPDIRIMIINSVELRAYDFAMLCMKTFRDNEMIAWLYPEYVIPRNQAKMLLPNRTRFFPDDTWNYRGFGGALEGTHNNLLLMDDIVGMEDLDANMMGSMSMEKAKRKFATSSKALLVKSTIDRVGVIGTRYALDDVYEARIDNCRAVYGFTEGNIKPIPGGVWDIYYRKWREHGKSIDPVTYDEEQMRALLVEDAWAYWTQFENDPREGSSLELYKMTVSRAFLERRTDGYYLVRTGSNTDPDDIGEVALTKCFLALGVDFAGTSRGITARTSKTALELWAKDGEGRIYLIEERCGYWDGSELVRQLFSLNRKFEGYININILESNAMQKALIPLIRDMAFKEELYFRYEPTPVTAPKDVRIRTIVGTALGAGNAYCVDGQGYEFLEQKDLFPASEQKKDALDAAAKAINALKKPWSDDEETEFEYMEEEESFRAVGIAGY